MSCEPRTKAGRLWCFWFGWVWQTLADRSTDFYFLIWGTHFFPEEPRVSQSAAHARTRTRRFNLPGNFRRLLLFEFIYFYILPESCYKQCCQFSNFVARFSDFPTPFETFFKSLGTNIATSWTNLIQVLILPTDLYSSLYRSVNLPLWCHLVTFSYQF